MDYILQTKNLQFQHLSYPDLFIPAHTTTFISGPSGCGKTTLYRLFNGTVTPDSGTILYRGVSIMDIDKIQLRRYVLLANQNSYLFRGTIESNFISYHQYQESVCPNSLEIQKLLKVCCMDVPVDTLCDTMSGGERQRIFLSIALSFHPDILLLDEPTSALNTDLSLNVMKNIIDFTEANKISLSVISHDLALQSAYAGHNIVLGGLHI